MSAEECRGVPGQFEFAPHALFFAGPTEQTSSSPKRVRDLHELPVHGCFLDTLVRGQSNLRFDFGYRECNTVSNHNLLKGRRLVRNATPDFWTIGEIPGSTIAGELAWLKFYEGTYSCAGRVVPGVAG